MKTITSHYYLSSMITNFYTNFAGSTKDYTCGNEIRNGFQPPIIRELKVLKLLEFVK